MNGHALRTVAALTMALVCSSPLAAQPTIEHGDVGCLPRGEFTEFLTRIQSSSEIRAAKLYFRSSLYPEFYFVEMTGDETGGFKAVLPLPSPETSTIVYYFEVVDVSFQTARSAELEASVSDDSGCRRGPGAILFPGNSPGIVVGATQAGMSAIPAGFQASGITGFLTATGVAGTGGGIGVGVAVGAAAGAAAGVGVIVAGGGGSDAATTTTPSPVGGGSTTSGPTATSSVSATTTSPAGSTTTTATGTTSSSAPGTSSVPPTSTISASTAPSTSTTTTSAPPLTACFEWQALGNCRVYFDSCSTPQELIERYEWRMLGPPVPDPPPDENFTFDFKADPRCGAETSFNHPVRLTVFDGLGRSAEVQQNVSVQSGATYRTERGASATLAFNSHLAALPADGSARAQIVVNGVRLQASNNASPSRHELRVGVGGVRIEATLLTPVAPGSVWELDFSSSSSVVRGSPSAEGGAVVFASDGRIAFRLNGDLGETLRLRLQVE